MDENVPIGFSTKCFSHTGSSLEQKVKICKSSGSNALEIDFTTDSLSLLDTPKRELKEMINSFDYLSLYAPTNRTYGDNPRANDILKRLKAITELVNVGAVCFHPTCIDDFDWLESFNLPVLLGNMDDKERRRIFRWASNFNEIFKTYPNLRLALNIQHAYDVDRNMIPAYQFLEQFRDRIRQVHFSGRTVSRPHWPMNCSDNGERIRQFIYEANLEIPHIAQGYFLEDAIGRTKDELTFINTRPRKKKEGKVSIEHPSIY